MFLLIYAQKVPVPVMKIQDPDPDLSKIFISDKIRIRIRIHNTVNEADCILFLIHAQKVCKCDYFLQFQPLLYTHGARRRGSMYRPAKCLTIKWTANNKQSLLFFCVTQDGY